MKNNHILSFYHCKTCLNDREDYSPREWARFEFGLTKKGFQLRCVRFDKNIVNLDLLGQKIAYASDGKVTKRDENQSKYN